MHGWLVVISALLLSAFFSGIEIAFVSANKLQIEIDRKKGLFAGRIFSNFLRDPSHFISTLLIGNNIVLVIYGMAMGEIINNWLSGILPANLQTDFFLLFFQTIISTLLILVTAEFIPKALFRIDPNYSLSLFSVPCYLFFVILYPINIFFTGIAKKILDTFFKVKLTQQNYTFNTSDLDHYLAELSMRNIDQSEISQEILLVDKAIELHNVKLRECMVPRNEIVAIEQQESIQSLRELFVQSSHSKIPVYDKSIDNIIGFARSYDLFNLPGSISQILRPIKIVPETMLAGKLLESFIQEYTSIAVIVDEFGGTSGMITLEDIIEEIFGEIYDEHDKPLLEEKQISANEYIFSGRLEIDYLNEKYHLELPKSDDYTTLAGFIIHHHESIPEPDDEIIISEFVFTILNASDNRIERVNLRLKE